MPKAFFKYTLLLFTLLFGAIAHTPASHITVKAYGRASFEPKQNTSVHVLERPAKVEHHLLAENVETEIEEDDHTSRKQYASHCSYTALFLSVWFAQFSSNQTSYLHLKQQGMYAVTPRYLTNCIFRI